MDGFGYAGVDYVGTPPVAPDWQTRGVADKPTRGSQTLADAHPHIASEWHPQRNGNLTPSDVSRSSMRMVWWRCSLGHEWQATVNNRERGRGCAVCGGRRVLAGFNDLATTEPRIAAEWHPTRNGDLAATDVTAGSNKRVWWLCPEGPDHEWQVSVANRTSPTVRSGCAVCAGRVVVPSTSLAVLFPEIASEWHPTLNDDLSPQRVTPFVTRRAWWRCGRGHEWQVAIAARTKQGTGCPYCAGRVPIEGETDLATTHPGIAAEWHPTLNGERRPSSVLAGSNRRVWWQCRAGHEWQATPVNRSHAGSGCPYCAGQRPVIGTNDLASTHPELGAELHPTRNADLSATDLMAGTSRKVWWRCELGHEWSAVVHNRSKGVGCPICANKQVLAGYNDLATTDPRLAQDLHPTLNEDDIARKVTRMSGRIIWWRCELGHEWRSNVANRSNGQGCPSCAPSGFTPSEDGWLYLLAHDLWQAQQVGITNHSETRLATHRRNGWEVLDVRGPMPGDLTASTERAALVALARRGAQLGKRTDAHRFDGYTEAWPTSTQRVDSLAEVLRFIADDEA